MATSGFFKFLKGIFLSPQSSPPPTPENGMIYYDSTLNQFQKYEAGSWSALGSGGGSASIPGVEVLEQKLEDEHYGIKTENFDNSLGSGFTVAPSSSDIRGVLLSDLPSSSPTMDIVWNPRTLSSTDKNTSTTANWSTEGQGNTLTTSATNKVGGASVSFNKGGSGTTAGIVYDFGSNAFGVVGNTNLWFWINLPSTTNLSNVYVEIDDGVNTATVNLTSSFTGAFIVGWNLMYVNLAAVSGSWNSSMPFRFFHVGVTTATSGQTYSGILINGVFFGLSQSGNGSITSPSNVIIPGREMTVYSNSVRNVIQLSSIQANSNTQVDGSGINLSVSPSNSFTAGFGSTSATVTRQTLALGLNQASMAASDQFGNSLGGLAAALTQEARLSKTFRGPLTGASVAASFSVLTPQVYPVVSAGGGSIVVGDPVNQTADLLTNDVVLIYRTVFEDGGKKSPILRGSMTLTSNATWSSTGGGQTTLSGTLPIGTVATDLVVKDHLSSELSAVSLGTDESFSLMSAPIVPDNILLYDNGTPIPEPANVVALYSLGSPNAQTNQQGTLSNLVLHGSLTQNAPFKQGMFSTDGWSTSNFYSIPNAGNFLTAASSMFISAWYYQSGGSARLYFLGDFTPPSTGWLFSAAASGTSLVNANVAYLTSGALSVGWHHVVFNYQSGVTNGSQVYIDGVLVATSTVGSLQNGSSDPVIGPEYDGSPTSPQSSDQLAQLLIGTGTILSATQVQQIYNNGLATVLGFGPQLKYRYLTLGVTGQVVSIKGTLSRHTLNVVPAITKMGLIKAS